MQQKATQSTTALQWQRITYPWTASKATSTAQRSTKSGPRHQWRAMSPKRLRTMRRRHCTTSSMRTSTAKCCTNVRLLTKLSYDFEEAAAKTASKKTFAFYSTAATDCWSRDMNSSMYKRIWFRPRVMKDVASIDTSSTILGIPVNVPLFICPTGLAKIINPEGEKALARAAKSTGIIETVRRILYSILPQVR